MKNDSFLHKLFGIGDSCPDLRFTEPAGTFHYDDILSRESDFIRSAQVMDASLWKTFVDQFRLGNADDETLSWKGEFWGKLMRGACFLYQASPDDELYDILEATVRDLLSTQDALGRIATYSVAREFTGWDIWSRKYVMLGLLYFLKICRDDVLREEILAALSAQADYLIAKIGHGDGKREIAACSNNWDGMNSCSILEPFVLLFMETKNPSYLEFSEYIASFGGTLHENYFQKVLEDKTPIGEYSQPKAYEMISCFEGLAELSKITGDEDSRRSVIAFADRMIAEEATVIGCVGTNSECLHHSSVTQSDSAFVPDFEFNGTVYHIMHETCVTVTWMKFMWQLWRMTGDAKYMEEIEHTVYNAMSAALNESADPSDNGGVLLPIHSYNPLRNSDRTSLIGGRQPIRENGAHYGCCVAIAAAGFALDTLTSAAHDSDGNCYLNLYRNGKIRFSGLTLDVRTDYPYHGNVKVSVLEAEDEKTLLIRIPAWAKKAEITHNGDTYTEKSGYAELTVRQNDEIEIDFPMDVRVLLPDDVADVTTGRNDRVCVCRGPVVYALDFTEEEEPVFPIDEDTVFTATDPSAVNVPCRSALTAEVGGKTVTLIDYRSAGQVAAHKVSAWIRVK